MHDLDKSILERRSVRGFLPDALVPNDTLKEVLQLAQHAPSNCNVQPWRVYVAQGARRDTLSQRLLAELDGGSFGNPDDPIDVFSEGYRTLQIECAVELYGAMGVGRDDHEGRLRGLRRNYEFFDAPQVMVIAMDQSFGLGVALDVGMYVQTLMLAMTSRGIASCAQASLRHYPHILRDELGIPAELRILCGLAFGYEDPAVPANKARQRRQPLENNVTFVSQA
jgi:nitroreductase